MGGSSFLCSPTFPGNLVSKAYDGIVSGLKFNMVQPQLACLVRQGPAKKQGVHRLLARGMSHVLFIGLLLACSQTCSHGQ